jgi:hypothetical protein
MKYFGNFTILSSAIGIVLLFILLTSTVHSASAHQKQLLSIGDKDYLFVVGNANEPVFIDDKSGVELFAYIPLNKTDQLSTDPNNTKPVQDLDKALKVEVSAGPQKKILDFEPDEDNPSHYIATFFPTVQTTYNYRIFGNISNTPVSLVWSCSPLSVSEDTVVSNSTVKLSDNVIRKAVVGGFGCPEPRSDKLFPEKYPPFAEMNSKITELQKEVNNQSSQNNIGNLTPSSISSSTDNGTTSATTTNNNTNAKPNATG